MSDLSQPMIQTLINARLNGSACHGKLTARALVNRSLAVIRQGTESDVELTELGVEVAEKLCLKQGTAISTSYKDTLEIETKKTQAAIQFIQRLNCIG